MSYIGTQPNNVKENIGLYTPNDITALTKDGNWGGSLELIQSQTVSGVSNVIFSSIKESKFDVHMLQATNYQPAGNDVLGFRFYESGVIESGTVYQRGLQYGYLAHTSSGAFGINQATGVSFISLLGDSTSTSTESGEGYCYIYGAGNSNQYTSVSLNTFGPDFFWYGMGLLPQASVVDGIYLYGVSTGQNFSGTFSLFGLKDIT